MQCIKHTFVLQQFGSRLILCLVVAAIVDTAFSLSFTHAQTHTHASTHQAVGGAWNVCTCHSKQNANNHTSIGFTIYIPCTHTHTRDYNIVHPVPWFALVVPYVMPASVKHGVQQQQQQRRHRFKAPNCLWCFDSHVFQETKMKLKIITKQQHRQL
jgi:hypothetical protein